MNKQILVKILILQIIFIPCFYFFGKIAIAAAPTISSLSPINNETYVSSTTDLTIVFSENIFADSGNIYVKRKNDNSIFETIDVTSGQVNISGATTTISLGASLENGTAFYVQIDNTCFKNIGEEYYTGIGDTTTWNFIVINDLYRTGIVKNIHPTGNFYATFIVQPKFLVANDFLYFSASDSGTWGDNAELWKTDGTEDGTILVKDIASGTSATSYPNFLTLFNDEVYFQARDTVSNGYELWKSDGTEDGTVMVKNINPSVNGHGMGGGEIFEFNNELYFSANDGINGVELWKSDGTESGTVMVKDIGSGSNSYPGGFVEFNNELYFYANDGVNGNELWKSDGTATGTVMVKNINNSANSYPNGFTESNGELFFIADDGASGNELWKTDGTATGTVMVKNINTSGASSPALLKVLNNELYFFAIDEILPGEINQSKLWKTDGTTAGTVVVKNINTLGDDIGYYYENGGNVHSEVINNILYFVANNGADGDELWKTDGTESGTVIVKDIDSSGDGVYLGARDEPLASLNNELYFLANDGIHGEELWKTDGTENGTFMLSNLVIDNETQAINNLIVMNDELYFAAHSTDYGMELFKTYLVTTSTVIIDSVTNILATSAEISGEIQSTGKENATDRGFVWSTSQNPTTANNDGVASSSGSFDIGDFNESITNLSCGTTYYVRAFATNQAGTGYSDQTSFSTCSAVSHAVTYNAYPTCGPATCDDGYHVSGSVCEINSAVGSGNIENSSVFVPATKPLASALVTISPTQSANLSNIFPDNSSVELIVPSNSVSTVTTFTVSKSPLTTVNTPIESSGAVLVGDQVFNISAKNSVGQNVSAFNGFLTITIKMPDMPNNISNLGVYYFNETNKTWELVTGAIFDTVNKKVIFVSNHLTIFAIFNIFSLNPNIAIKAVNANIEVQPVLISAPNYNEIENIINRYYPLLDTKLENKFSSKASTFKGFYDLNETEKDTIIKFSAYGTPSTKILGAGERLGVINSYLSAFGKLPKTANDFSDIIKISTGHWPTAISPNAIVNAEETFKFIYLREADMNQSNDNAAVTIMAYGLRSANRNLNSEKTAIGIYKAIFKKNPSEAVDWDAVRAIAYSGAKR